MPKDEIMGTENGKDWHIRLFKKSLLKQAKWSEIRAMLPPMEGRSGLDIGSDNGVISYLLRRGEGEWRSAEAGSRAVAAVGDVIGEDVADISSGRLPYGNEEFDCVIIIDMLEHLEDDEGFIRECHRVLRPSGKLIVNVPHLKRYSFVRMLRRLLGLTDAEHGHLRPGYTRQQLFTVMKDGFDVEISKTYSRLFVETLDTCIRFAVKLSGDAREQGEKGMIMNSDSFGRIHKLFRIYSLLYPIFWIASKLDHLLFFTGGHYLVARSRRRLWIPRRVPVLKDGRSIADAALNTKIGSANPF